MYGGIGADLESEHRMRKKAIEAREAAKAASKAEIEKATAMFPGLPRAEARAAYREYTGSKETSFGLQREYGPIFAAAAAGLLIFTFLRK